MSQVPSAGGELTPAAPTGAYVLCRVRAGQPLRFRLSSGAVVAGSDAGVGIPLPLPGVSRQHLKLVFEKGSWWVQDLDSSNGTFLNGRLVARDRLRHLDVIGVGRSVDLLFLQRDEAPAALRRGITHAAIVAERGQDAVQPIDVGEITLGRSSACNIQVEGAAISKIHARLERSAQQLTLRDLGSANGTFVNGQQITVAALKDGDVISLGEMVRFRVVLEFGEVKTLTGARPLPEIPEEQPALSMDWKTRYDWDEAEMKQIAELQQKLRERDEQKKVPRRDTEKAMPAAKPPAAGKPAVEKPAAAAPKPAPEKPPAEKPVVAKPVAPATPPVPVVEKAAVEKPAPPAEQPAVAPAPKPEPPRPATTAPAKPRPAAAPPAPASEEPPPTMLPGQLTAPAAEPSVRRVLLVSATEQLAAEGQGRFAIGRANEAALRPQHPTVSRKHATLVVTGPTVQVEDAGGRAGTFVNGQPVTAPVAVKDGDQVLFGEARYEVRIER